MEQAISQFLIAILKFVAPRRNQIMRILQILTIAVVLGWLATYLYATTNLDTVFVPAYEVGKFLGEVALILYVLTLLPGIITRLRFRPTLTQPIASILLPFRRQFGVLMFILAFVHMSFTTTMAQLIENGGDIASLKFAQFQLLGIFAWWSLFPLWLTSNDLSVKRLGKWWKIIHKLTYLALFFIFLHVFMQKSTFLYLMLLVGGLEIISWVMYWQRPRVAAPV